MSVDDQALSRALEVAAHYRRVLHDGSKRRRVAMVAGPRWSPATRYLATLALVLVTGLIAWLLPPEGSFGVDVFYKERFFGNTAALLLIIATRRGSFGPMERYLRRRIRQIKVA